MTISGSKKDFGGPFVSFMIGSYLGLQSIAAYTVWQMEGLIPQPHILCFISSKTSGSNLQKHSHSRFIPGSHYRVNSVNSPSNAMLCPAGLPQRVVCLCNAQYMEGLGPWALLVKLSP